jgi:hypothetical protein
MADDLATGTPDLGGGSLSSDTTPQAIEISDTSLIKAPGLDKPVAYKDFISGYVSKADLTRMRQSDSQALERDRQAIKQQEAQLKAAAQQLAQRLGPQQGSATDPLAELANAPYVDGKTVASIVQALRSELQKRDQAISLMHQQFQSVQQGFSSIQGRNQEAELSQLFGTAQKHANLPDNPEVRSLIESEYHAHTGWETVTPDERVTELSRIVKQRYDGITAAIRAADKARVDDARRLPAKPIAPKLNGRGIKGMESAEDLASRLYPLIQPTPGT